MTLIGWFIVALGFLGLLLSWGMDLPHGIIDLMLAALTILAGILVIQQSVVALQEYVSVPFPAREPLVEPVQSILSIMEDIRRGGWRDASSGIGKLEAIAGANGMSDREGTVSQIFQEQ
jgi:hypothetical protein